MSLSNTFLKISRSCARCPNSGKIRALSTQTTSTKEGGGKSKQTHFGFQTVDEQEKWKKVHEVFEVVAEKYDVMNDAMSLGIHRLWKDALVQRLAPTPGTRLLDVAGGTGDISFRYVNWLRNAGAGAGAGAGGAGAGAGGAGAGAGAGGAGAGAGAGAGGAGAGARRSAVTVCDINQAMLDVGKLRAHKLGLTPEVTGVDMEWRCGDAESLPFADDSYTAYTIAFGIRNCTHVDKVLEEAYRVLAPGGRFLCLEFSQLRSETMQWLYDQYSFQVIPVLGQLIAGQWKPYQYLVESIRQFPNQEKFKAMIEDAGFRQVTYENLTFGVCAIHSGFKI